MKKVLAVLLLLVLAIPATAESVDLDSLSFQELAALRDRIQLVMMQRDEWQEVAVPQGVYKIGEDIPAGTWVVKCNPNFTEDRHMEEAYLEWGKSLNETKTKIDYHDGIDTIYIHNPNSKYYEGGITEYILVLIDGYYLVIDPFWNSVIFAPYTGKPDLGFK